MADPFKTLMVMVTLMQCAKVAVHVVYITHQALHAGMERLVQQMPVQSVVGIPFAPLRNLAAHEQQLLTRVSPHQCQIRPQIGKGLPLIAWHARDEGTLAMHHFVMRQRQYKVLGKGVHQAKGQLVLMVPAVDWIHRKIAQGVMHPAHVPLVVKTQSTGFGWLCHFREGCGFFGQGDRTRPLHPHHLVHALQKGNRLQVLAPTVGIGNPLSRLATVVTVQHAGHRVHTQAINTKTLQPVQGIAHQVVAYFDAGSVEDQRVPVLMKALARVSILIQSRSIKLAQAMTISWEMRGYPIQDHTQASIMCSIDKS